MCIAARPLRPCCDAPQLCLRLLHISELQQQPPHICPRRERARVHRPPRRMIRRRGTARIVKRFDVLPLGCTDYIIQCDRTSEWHCLIDHTVLQDWDIMKSHG